MEIRRLSGRDAEVYREIRLEGLKLNPEAFGSSYEEEKDYSVERFHDRLQAEQSFTYGAFVEGELAGVVTIVPEGKLKMKHRANIYAMYVRPSFRGKGAGKKLVLAAVNQAKTIQDIEQIYLAVVASNEPAKRLYSSTGFEVYGLDKKALQVDGTYYDEELMVLFL